MLTFLDKKQNRNTVKEFEFNGKKLKVSQFNKDELAFLDAKKKTIDKGKKKELLDAFDRAMKKLVEDDEAWTLMAEITGFSKENLEHFSKDFLKKLSFHDFYQQVEKNKEYFISKNPDIFKDDNSINIPFKEKANKKFFGTKEPQSIAYSLAGNLVGPYMFLPVLGKIIGATQIVKLPSENPVSVPLFLEKLAEIESDLLNDIYYGYWTGGDEKIEKAVIKRVKAYIAFGSDQAMNALKEKINKKNRVSFMKKTGYSLHGHKVSFQVVDEKSLEKYTMDSLAVASAWGITAFDTNACFSPQTVFVQGEKAEAFAQCLFEHLKNLAEHIPIRKRKEGEKNRIIGFLNEINSANLFTNIKLFNQDLECGVVYHADGKDLKSCPNNRFVNVVKIDSVDEVPKIAAKYKGYLQTAGIISETNEQFIEFAKNLGKAGLTNVHLIGKEYNRDFHSPHDGVFIPTDLIYNPGIRWTNIALKDVGIETQFQDFIDEISFKQKEKVNVV